MVDFYADHGNTTLYPTAYMSVPASAASLPQDGDGTVNGLGATPAVSSATWDLTSASASSGQITVMGATVTGLTASGSALATAIASAINASTAATTAPNGNCGSVYLKALCWAVASGTTLTVYSRIASAALNYATNVACAMAAGSGWTSAPAMAQFSGGVSGPWSSLFNVAALAAAVSPTVGTTVGGYGAITATVMGAVTDGDRIFMRTKRSGANITITLSTSAITVTTRSLGTAVAPLFIIADNGIKWPGDAGVLTISLDSSINASRNFYAPAVNGSKQIWLGTRLTDDTCNWRFELTGVPSTTYNFSVGSAPSLTTATMELSGIEISGSGGGYIDNQNYSTAYVRIRSSYNSSSPSAEPRMLVRDLVFRNKGMCSPFFADQTSGTMSYQVSNSKLDHSGLSVASSDAIVYGTGAARLFRFYAENVQWVGFPAQANLSGFQRYSTSNRATFRLINCQFPNIKVSGGVANGGFVGSPLLSSADDDIVRSISITSILGIRAFVFENDRLSVAWYDSNAPRTLASYLPDGVTNFSLRYAVSSEIGTITSYNPAIFPALAKHNTLADGTRTATLRLLVDNNIVSYLGASPKNNQIWVHVGYVGTDGGMQIVTTKAGPLDSATTLTSGASGDWTAVTYDVNGVSHNYTAFEISVSLPSVKSLTEISLGVRIGCQSASVDNLFIVDPEWGLS